MPEFSSLFWSRRGEKISTVKYQKGKKIAFYGVEMTYFCSFDICAVDVPNFCFFSGASWGKLTAVFTFTMNDENDVSKRYYFLLLFLLPFTSKTPLLVTLFFLTTPFPVTSPSVLVL